MKLFITVFLLCGLASAQPCVIAKIHKKTGGDALRWGIAKPYEYIEGDFPADVKFRHELNDKNIRELKKKGAKFVVLQNSYTLEELNDARRQCREQAK